MPGQKLPIALKWHQVIDMKVNVLSIDITLVDKLEKIDLNSVTHEDIQVIKQQLPAMYYNMKKENAA